MKREAALIVAVLALAAWARSSGHVSPTRFLWHVSPLGLVEVNGAPLSLTTADARRFELQVRPWTPLVGHVLTEDPTGPFLSIANVLGFIWAESRGNPLARSPAGALGLMQVLSSEARAGHTDAELLEPLTNVRAGVGYLKRIARAGDALPELASKYNAGQDASGRPHLSAASPWGMREQPGYIETVARASNYATTTEGSRA
jgi:hypothetical protein